MCNFFLSKSAAKMAPKGSITSQKKTPQGPGGNSADAEDDGVELVGINDAVTDRVNLLTSTGKVVLVQTCWKLPDLSLSVFSYATRV